MKLAVRMVATDMDGTLLTNDKKLTPDNIAVLKELRERGIHVVVCTGRHPDNARFVLAKYGLVFPVIGLNGSLIFDKEAGVLAAHPFDASSVREVVAILEKNHMDYFVFTLGYVVLREQIPGTYTGAPLINYVYEISNGNYRAGTAEVEKALGGDVYKVAAFNRPNPALLEKTRAELKGLEGISVSKSSEINVEIMPRGIDKGSGLREYSGFVNIPLGETLSLGDQENDLPMLRSTGFSIAMANAPHTVKQAVNYETAGNEDDGFARALRKYILQEKPWPLR
ncbi:MAG: HAD family hydrolase [Treponema sp.]|nr:HAD family hydrolase [Treponema sp.]